MRRSAKFLESAQTFCLPRSRTKHRIVIVKTVELIGVNVTHRMHDVNVFFNARRTANLQHIDSRRRKRKYIGFEKAKCRISSITLADVLRSDSVIQTSIEYRIIFIACQIGALHTALMQRFQHRLKSEPVGSALRIKNNGIVF